MIDTHNAYLSVKSRKGFLAILGVEGDSCPLE